MQIGSKDLNQPTEDVAIKPSKFIELSEVDGCTTVNRSLIWTR